MAVMGQNLALNIADKLKPSGASVAVCNRSPSKVDDTVERAAAEGLSTALYGYKDVSPTLGAVMACMVASYLCVLSDSCGLRRTTL